MEHDPALTGDIAAEQDVDVVELPGKQRPPGGSADRDAVRAVVVRIDVVLALGVVELRRAALDDDVSARALAEIDAWLGDGRAAGGNRRNVLQVEIRQTLGGFLRHRGHDHTAAVGEQQMQVDPGLRVGRQQRRRQFARSQRHLPIGAVDPVAIDVDVKEPVVGADFLKLRIGVHQRLPVPQPDVVDGVVVGLQRLERQSLLGRKGLHRNLPEIVRFPREGDVSLNIRRFQLQFARLDEETLEHAGEQFAEQERGAEHERGRRDDQPIGAQPHVDECDNGSGGGDADQQPEHRQLDIDIGIAGTDHDAVVVVEQQEAIQRIGPGLHREVAPSSAEPWATTTGEKRQSRLSRAISPCSTYTAPAMALLNSSINIIQFFSAT